MVLCLLGMIYSMDSWTVKPNERGSFHSQGIKFSIFYTILLSSILNVLPTPFFYMK